MTPLIRTIIAIAILSCAVAADDKPLSYGAYGGFSFGFARGSALQAYSRIIKAPNADLITSGNGGLRLNYHVNDWFEIMSGLHVSGYGYRMKLDFASDVTWYYSTPISISSTLYRAVHLFYGEFPVIMRLQSPSFEHDQIRVFCFSGVSAARILSATGKVYREIEEYDASTANSAKDNEILVKTNYLKSQNLQDSLGKSIPYDFDDFYRRYNLFFIAGAGAEKRFKSLSFYLQMQFQGGLIDFCKNAAGRQAEIAALANLPEQLFYHEINRPALFFSTMQISAGVNIYRSR